MYLFRCLEQEKLRVIIMCNSLLQHLYVTKTQKNPLYIKVAAPPVAAVQYVIKQYCPGALKGF